MHMDVLKHKGRPKHTVRIVDTYMKDGKQRKKVFEHVGKALPGPDLEALKTKARAKVAQLRRQRAAPELHPDVFDGFDLEMALQLRARQATQRPLVRDVMQLQHLYPVPLGIYEVFDALFDQMGLGSIWSARHRVAAPTFKWATLLRLAYPGWSKRAQVHALQPLQQHPMPLQRMYRMMSHLDAARIDCLKTRIADYSRALQLAPPTVAFVDVTTVRFCSERETTLLRHGRSKDHRPDKVQVGLALVLTADGMPLTYEVFPGNTQDITTLQPMLDTLRRHWGVGRAIVCADAGFRSQANMTALCAAGFEYVVATAIRSLPKAYQTQIRAWQPARHGATLDINGPHGQRLVVRYSADQATREAHRREALRSRLQAEIGQGAPKRLIKGAKRRFVKYRGQGRMVFDHDAFTTDGDWDGKHGVMTSLSRADATPGMVRDHYRQLWQIEASFRVLKHDLMLRPVFHWTEPRVRAHIAICYAAFALLRTLRRHLPASLSDLSEANLLQTLHRFSGTVSELKDSKEKLLIPYRVDPNVRAIYRALKIPLTEGAVALNY